MVRTAELYYRLRYVATARATLERQRALLAAGVDISTARYASTSAPQSDPLQARVALARLEADDAELAGEAAALRARLKALRDVSGPDPVPLAPIRADLVAQHLPLNAPDSLPDHPRLAARRAEVEAAEATARVEQLAGRPDFMLMTRYGARPVGSDFFSAFVGVRVPLYAGRKQHRLAAAARADADAARASLAEERAGLAEEIRAVAAEIASGAERLRLLTGQVVPAAQATVDASLRSYRVGRVEFTTVLASEDALYRAQLDAARVAAEHLTHLVMLEQLTRGEDQP